MAGIALRCQSTPSGCSSATSGPDPGLSVRDRRLMVFGIAASLGRADLIEVQLLGALRNGEIEPAQVDEIVLHLAYYVGWPQTSPIQQGASAALAKFAAECEEPKGSET